MFDKIKIYLLIGVVSLLVGSIVVLYINNKSLENSNENLTIEVSNGKKAIMAYEELLKVAPFEAKNKEKKENTDDKVNTLNSDGRLITGPKWM